MRRQEKFGKVHFVLIALTLVFLGALAVSVLRERGAAAGDAYRVKTGRAVSAETAEYTETVERAGVDAGKPLDINAATEEELQELIGIGPALARAIVDYRAEHGPFRSVDELLEVSGIGEGKLGGFREEVTVNGG